MVHCCKLRQYSLMPCSVISVHMSGEVNSIRAGMNGAGVGDGEIVMIFIEDEDGVHLSSSSSALSINVTHNVVCQARNQNGESVISSTKEEVGEVKFV